MAGALPDAPSVTAVSTALTHSTAALTCTAAAVPEAWKVVRRWTPSDVVFEMEETFPGTSATQVLEAETCEYTGEISYSVSAKIDGVWICYSDPVTVILEAGAWEAPHSLYLGESGRYVSSVYAGIPYTLVWGGVGYGMVGYEVRVTDSEDTVLLQTTVAPDPDHGYKDYTLDFEGFPAAGDYIIAVRTLGDNVSGLDSAWLEKTVTVSFLQGRVEATELAGLPEGAWSAGSDLTLTFTPAEHTRYYILSIRRSSEDSYDVFFDSEGAFTLEGMHLTAGEYVLTFQPEPEDGYVLAEGAIKTYALTVTGSQPAAPAVTLADASVQAGTQISLQCEAAQTPELWSVSVVFYEEDGSSYSHSEVFQGESAAQTLTLDANSRVGRMDFSVCAKVDGVWSLYSDPVSVTLTPGPWDVPTNLRLTDGDTRVTTVYMQQPYTLRWRGVGYGMTAYEFQGTNSQGGIFLSGAVAPDPDHGYKDYSCDIDSFPAPGDYTLAVRTLGDGVNSLDSDWAKITVTVRDYDLTLTVSPGDAACQQRGHLPCRYDHRGHGIHPAAGDAAGGRLAGHRVCHPGRGCDGGGRSADPGDSRRGEGTRVLLPVRRGVPVFPLGERERHQRGQAGRADPHRGHAPGGVRCIRLHLLDRCGQCLRLPPDHP